MNYFIREYEWWRAVDVTDGTGGWVRSWTPNGTIPGRAYKKSITYRAFAVQLAGDVTWTFACDPEHELKNGDEIRFDGRRLTIKAQSVTSSGQRLEALCQELQF